MVSSAELKEQGNTAFRAKKYFEAHDLYTKALAECAETEKELKISICLNLCLCEGLLERAEEAIEHATEAINLDPSNGKAYYRRANAKILVLDLTGAYSDMVQLCKIMPSEKKFRQDAEKIRSEIKRAQLLQAMAAQEGDSIQKIEQVEPPAPVEIPEFNKEFADATIENLRKDIRVHRDIFRALLKKMEEIQTPMANIVELKHKGTFYIVGDTHGQFQDVVNIFEKFGWPTSENPYLFNGDYVDRGSQGIEILTLLMVLKLANPDSIYLNRGNHETLSMNHLYGFEGECVDKYNTSIYDECTKMFNTLPLGHLINGRTLIVHGGICTDDYTTLADVQKLSRFQQPPETGPINDILWSDPMEQRGLAPSPRGVTRTFGPDITEKFCKRWGIEMVIRSHQVMQEGFCEMHDGKCNTVFSAPNYTGQMGNRGAILAITYNEDGSVANKEFRKFEALPFPEKYRPMKYASFGRFF